MIGTEQQRNGQASEPALETAPGSLPAASIAVPAFELPVQVAAVPPTPPVDGSQPIADPRQAAGWDKAVEAGKAIGTRSEQAAVATAGFFTRIGKQVARSF